MTLSGFLRTTRLVLALALTAALAGVPAHAQRDKRKDADDSAPVLVSTKGGGSGWKSIAHLQEEAAAGNPKACYDLALLCLEGANEVKQDIPRALALYEQAARGGIHDAWFRLGKVHHDGLGVTPDRAKGFGYFLEAAKRGVPEAQYNVGAMLASGRGVRRDYSEALAWLIVATKSGAEGDGETQLREMLTRRRPRDLAEGERRAAEILASLEAGEDPNATPAAPAPAVPEPPKLEPPSFRPPAADAPKVEMPVAPIAPPVIPPKP